MTRKERDFIGEADLPQDALYGIHSLRARNNFNNQTTFSKDWYCAIGLVKKACYLTAISFAAAAKDKYPQVELPAGCEDMNIIRTLGDTAHEVSHGMYFEHFIVPAIQGGAGTAINLNINEIITNASLLRMGHKPGNYDVIDPFVHANIFQSTNDVIPTALRVAAIKQFLILETSINELRSALEDHEQKGRDKIRIAYTQMQQAVPSSFGLLFSAWTDALSRDWWRVSKCMERIKVSNLGGGATGTGMAIPRYFIMEVTNKLRELTGLPVTRSENLTDTTQNLDVFVEVHATIKAHAVNLEKIAADIRLLASDLFGNPELLIPQKQIGSSIMPGKINPVINEFVISCAHKVYSNDVLISNLCGQGTLELNPYLPVIGNALLESLHLMIEANNTLLNNLVKELHTQADTAWQKVLFSASLTTALIPSIGYRKASDMAFLMKEKKIDIRQANSELQYISEPELERYLRPENLLKLGYSIAEK